MTRYGYKAIVAQRTMHREEVKSRYGIELEPCPFCTGRFNLGVYMSDYPHGVCLNCLAEGPPTSDKGNVPHAAQLWNHREPPPVLEYGKRDRSAE